MAETLAETSAENSQGKLRSSGPLLAANLLEALLPFARNIALARLISPEEFGLAVSLSVVMGIIEVLTDFGLPIFAVRKTTPVPPTVLMGTLQSLALVRASVLALILVAISPFVARAFHAGDSAGIYALLGLIAFLRGFENFGVKEMMRRYVFWREAVVLGSAQVVGVAVTVAIAAAAGGFACMIWGMLATTLTTVLLSHLLSPLPYRLAWNRAAARDAASFGRPLVVNGMAVALGLSDRVLVGSVLGPTLLAFYNVAYGTATLPRTVLAKFLTSAFLPLFVEHRERGGASSLFDTWAWCLSCLAFTYGLGLSLVGDRILALVFSAAYQPSRLFMCLAGMSVCVKFLMLLPVPAAYASGNTRLVTCGSVLSALSIVPGAACLAWQRNLDLFLLAVTLTEFAALILYGTMAMREQAFTRTAAWLAIAVPVTLLAALAATTLAQPQLTPGAWFLACGLALLVSVAAYGAMILRFRIGLRVLISNSA
ncbi:oligosaccharide flippase family protein [Methylobacterium nigriterrae]|uniref:oligosaccharide flippase family protein n=1 Tax=Methylobacterium nigriterrae TaxID=3127512 RepID=UPI003013C582